MKEDVNTRSGLLGKYIIHESDCTSDLALEYIYKIKQSSGVALKKLLKTYHKLFSINKIEINNIVPNIGLASLAENIINASPIPSESLKILYGAVGTGTDAPIASNVSLGVEQYRQLVNSQSRVGNIAYNTVFIDNNSSNGVLISEFGLFSGESTGTSNSGTLFSHLPISPSFDKTSDKTLTIEASHTFKSI